MSISAPSWATAGGGGGTSTITAETTTGWHELKLESYTRTKGGVGKGINSATFTVGGHRWYIRYYPDGNCDKSANWISVYLYLTDPIPVAAAGDGGGDVKAKYKFSLIDDAGDEPVASCTKTSKFAYWTPGKPRGYHQFIKGTDLLESLKGDGFRIRCEVTVMREICEEAAAAAAAEPLAVPPPELHRHLSALLDGGVGGDVTFHVGLEQFTAHRCVLAARSPVLMAELFGPMKENAAMASVRVDDMEPRVFGALLRFVYSDSLPEVDEDDDVVGMAQHLLVAADRYSFQRMKVMCEAMLLKHMDASVLATTLTLAEQHGCEGLKEGCFRFLRCPGNTKAVVESDGFQHLRSSCPSLIEEMLVKVAP
ncbi:hypothetical protein U9M48_001579 [Paspalum notatum var. saurae]|uniref:BTB/POZ and MATH domain-containing protein 1 n=1 Tax=Paspalum notatum var. saurae TaxID=547442 RepID=A0AAQ3SJ39_PASNO